MRRSKITEKYLHLCDLEKLENDILSKKIKQDSVNILFGATECEKIRYIDDINRKFSDVNINLNLSVGNESSEDLLLRLKSGILEKILNICSPKNIFICTEDASAIVKYVKETLPNSDVIPLEFENYDKLKEDILKYV